MDDPGGSPDKKEKGNMEFSKKLLKNSFYEDN